MPSLPSPSRAGERDDTVVIRLADAADMAQLDRMALLDGAPRPLSGRILVAEVQGALQAALAIDSGRAIADPFRPTADLVALLAKRAELLRGAGRTRTRGPGLLRRHAGALAAVLR